MATEEKQKTRELKTVEPARGLSPFEEIDKMFENFFSRGWLHPFSMEMPSIAKSAMPFEGRPPKVDIINRDDEVLVKAELPGVDKKDIDISLTENTVTIRGKTSHEEKEEKGDYYRCEMTRGSYTRTLSLPADIDEEKSKAKFKDGILELTLPKLQKSKRRTIKVE
ncbi:MAG: Hsp20/alpha crystallin family protein [Thioalkalispiraceae bacterium]|jgi:HSP20 family protein